MFITKKIILLFLLLLIFLNVILRKIQMNFDTFWHFWKLTQSDFGIFKWPIYKIQYNLIWVWLFVAKYLTSFRKTLCQCNGHFGPFITISTNHKISDQLKLKVRQSQKQIMVPSIPALVFWLTIVQKYDCVKIIFWRGFKSLTKHSKTQ